VLSLKDAAVLPPDVYLLVRGDVEEEVGILGSRVFRAVGRRERHRQHDRFVGAVLLRLPQKGDGVVGDQVGVVVLQTKKTFRAAAKQ
jgi:hypothetical protein